MTNPSTNFIEMVKSYLTPGAARPEQNVVIEVPKRLLDILCHKVNTNGTLGSTKEERELALLILQARVHGESIQPPA